jgi:glycosyltransferase involved in cell wall biosynthesis
VGSREQTFSDKVISAANSIRYRVLEPGFLRVNRMRFEREYEDATEEPLISVYVPTYNRADLLMERAVPSVLAQSYTNFEFIVVGDHCTDKTEEFVRGIRDPRIRFYNMPKRGRRYPPTAENHWLAGPVVPANQGLRMVRGKWIARIDDDDTWTEDHLEALLHLAQTDGYEFVSGQYVQGRRGEDIIHTGERATGPYHTLTGKTSSDDGAPLIGGTQTWLYRSYLRFIKYNLHCWRKQWNRVNDIEISLRIYQAGVRMGFLNKVVAHVLPRPGEDTIGLEAYLAQEKLQEEHFKFSA